MVWLWGNKLWHSNSPWLSLYMCSDALSESGLAAISAGALWSLGSTCPAVMVELLQLLASSASASKAMRLSWAAAPGNTAAWLVLAVACGGCGS